MNKHGRLALFALCLGSLALQGCAITRSVPVNTDVPMAIDVNGSRVCDTTPCELALRCKDSFFPQHADIAASIQGMAVATKRVDPCSASQIVFESQATSSARLEAQERLAKFLRQTPHEVCADKTERSRHESLKECKADAIRRQDQIRTEIAREEQNAEARRQMAIQFLMSRPPASAPAFQPTYIQPQPQMKVFVPPPVQQQPQPINCTTTRTGTISSTTCR